MHRSMVQCNGVQTQIITDGRWIEENFMVDGNKDVILIIPGNPGVPHFYEGFIKSMRSRISPEIPIWVMGQAGHVQPSKELCLAMPRESENTHYYDIEGQIKNKIEFIKKYVPADANLHIIGHSIGSYFTLNILKDDSIRDRIKKCYLLFPTIEHMGSSKNGKFFTNFLLRIAFILIFLSSIFIMFPYWLQVILVRVFGVFFSIPSKSIDAIITMIHPKVLRRIFTLAKEEMEKVKELDHETIDKYADKLWLYYGTTDGWVPVRYYKQMIEKHPNVKAQLCTRGIAHTFVLNYDDEMGRLMADVINENLTKK